MACGPACLAMIADHVGRPHPDHEQIREDCTRGKAVVSLFDISKAAKKREWYSLGGCITSDIL